MRKPSRFQPEGALADLRYFIGRRQPHQFVFFALALALTLVAIVAVAHDSKFTPEYHRDIVYVEQWPLTRTDKEIIAQQKVDALVKSRRLEAEDRERKANQAKFKAIDDKLKRFGI